MLDKMWTDSLRSNTEAAKLSKLVNRYKITFNGKISASRKVVHRYSAPALGPLELLELTPPAISG